MEYRTKYFYKKLLFTQVFFDFGSAITSREFQQTYSETHQNTLTTSDINTNTFLKEFLTAEEKTLLQSLNTTRLIDLETESNFLVLSAGIGLDLWFLEFSIGPFLMYYESIVSLRSCKNVSFGSWGGSDAYMPNKCQINPDKIIKLDEQKVSGFAYGFRQQISLVFLQTDNWRVSMEFGNLMSEKSSTKYRGLTFLPGYYVGSKPTCTGTQVEVDGTYRQVECKTPKGDDMSDDSDITKGLQITYYFR